MPEKKDQQDNAAVEKMVAALRQKAEAGELGDDALEDVAGGHLDVALHLDSPDSLPATSR